MAKMLPIFKAFARGKTIEFRRKGSNEDWREVTNIKNLSSNTLEYRIKTIYKYRPFNDACVCVGAPNNPLSYEQLFNDYTFMDGAKFGTKVEK